MITWLLVLTIDVAQNLIKGGNMALISRIKNRAVRNFVLAVVIAATCLFTVPAAYALYGCITGGNDITEWRYCGWLPTWIFVTDTHCCPEAECPCM